MTVHTSHPVSSGRRALAVPAALLALALVLTGCSDEEGPDAAKDPGPASQSPSSTPPASPTEPAGRTDPACAEVWVVGQALPKPYRGCFDVDRERWVEPDVYQCSSGQRIVTYGRTFYAVQNREVVETDGPRSRDQRFRSLMATCGA